MELTKQEKSALWHMNNGWLLQQPAPNIWQLFRPEQGTWFSISIKTFDSLYAKGLIWSSQIDRGVVTMSFTDEGAKAAIEIKRSDFEKGYVEPVAA